MKIIRNIIMITAVLVVLLAVGCGDDQKETKPTEVPAPTATPDPDIVPLPTDKQGKDYWKGKKIAFLGDSITELNGYQSHVKSFLEAEILSFGLSGSTIAGYNQSFVMRSKDVDPEADLVFVFGGTNDYTVSWELGSIDKRASNNHFYGAVQNIIKNLKEQCPNALIVFITPIQRGVEAAVPDEESGLSLADYANAIKEVCKKNNVPVLDLYKTSKITEENAWDYLHDGLHPNEDGYYVLAIEMAQYLCPEETFPQKP